MPAMLSHGGKLCCRQGFFRQMDDEHGLVCTVDMTCARFLTDRSIARGSLRLFLRVQQYIHPRLMAYGLFLYWATSLVSLSSEEQPREQTKREANHKLRTTRNTGRWAWQKQSTTFAEKKHKTPLAKRHAHLHHHAKGQNKTRRERGRQGGWAASTST